MLASDVRRRTLSSVCSVASRGIIAWDIGALTSDRDASTSGAHVQRPAFGAVASSRSNNVGVSTRFQQAHGWTSAVSAAAAVCSTSGCSQQARAFSWRFWHRDTPAPVALEDFTPEEPPLDVDLVETISHVADPAYMDPFIWPAVEQGVWYHTWAAQHVLGLMHDGLALPWLLAIPAASCMMRTMILPLNLMMMKSSFNMARAKPDLDRAQRDMMAFVAAGGDTQDAQAMYLKDISATQNKYKVYPWSVFVPVFVSMPCTTGFYFAFSSICVEPLPSLMLENTPWGVSWSSPDPLFITPCITVVTFGAALWGPLARNWATWTPESQKMVRTGMIVAPPLLIALFSQLPTALCFYWASSNVYSIFQELALRIPPLRKSLGLPSNQEMIDLALQQREAAANQGSAIDDMMRLYDATQRQETGGQAPSNATAASGSRTVDHLKASVAQQSPALAPSVAATVPTNIETGSPAATEEPALDTADKEKSDPARRLKRFARKR